MHQFIEAVERSLQQRNYYAALMVAMSLPDICGHIDGALHGKKRYIDWFDQHVARHYFIRGEQWLSGRDFYALRCSLLHQGGADISMHKIRETLDRFMFVQPPDGSIHCNLINLGGRRILQLQVDEICRQITGAAAMWWATIDMNPQVEQRLNDTAVIHGRLNFHG